MGFKYKGRREAVAEAPKPDVPVGLSTNVGLGTSGVAFALAILAFIQGDRSEQTLGVVAAGVVGIVSLGITMGGRMIQARAQINAQANPAVVHLPVATTELHEGVLAEGVLAEGLVQTKTDEPEPPASGQRGAV